MIDKNKNKPTIIFNGIPIIKTFIPGIAFDSRPNKMFATRTVKGGAVAAVSVPVSQPERTVAIKTTKNGKVAARPSSGFMKLTPSV